MSQPKKRNKIGATPGKLALVGVLSLVLVVVIVQQLPKRATANAGGATVSQKQATVTKTKPTKTESTNLAAKNPRLPSELPSWPEIDFTKTLASNPFALPRWEVQRKPTVVDPQEGPGELAELRKQGASIVVIGKEKKTATIGEQKYHVGDILEGYQVTDITTRGIVLNKLDSH